MPGFSDPPPGASGPTLQSQSEAPKEQRSAGGASKRPEPARQVHQGHQNRTPSHGQRSLISQLELQLIRKEDL